MVYIIKHGLLISKQVKDLIQIDINKMVTYEIFTMSDKHT